MLHIVPSCIFFAILSLRTWEFCRSNEGSKIRYTHLYFSWFYQPLQANFQIKKYSHFLSNAFKFLID